MKQLFANNAKTSLANSIANNGTALVVADGSAFPTPGAYEFFLVTIELGNSVEVVMITGRTGNTLTIGGLLEVGETIPGRGIEGTGAKNFAAGARVECRVTKGTLGRFSTSLAQVSSVTDILAPRDSYQEGYVTSTFDPFGNPVITIVRDQTTWRFPNFTNYVSATSTAATTTTVTAASITIPDISSGKYLIQFTSGTQTGKIRVVTSCVGNVVTWSGALPVAPVAGNTFEILKSNASILFDVLSIGDDAVIMPLLLGGE
jgi:hypothetical protein